MADKGESGTGVPTPARVWKKAMEEFIEKAATLIEAQRVEVIPALFELPVHSAAAGITAYRDDRFPGYYNDLFLALWSAFEGAQNVIRVGAERSEMSVFATGFAQPIDVTAGPDGDLYVTDYATGIIFRIRHTG